MKILSVAWTIYDERLEQFMHNCTGGGLVIKNICEYIGRKEQSYLLIGKTVLPKMELDHIHIVKSDYEANRKNVKGQNKDYLQYMTIVFKKAIEEIKPDIVNFHGYGEFAFLCIEEVCKKFNINYVVTDHLFVSQNDKFGGYEDTVKDECYLYSIPNIHIIAVSNGMKTKILREFTNIDEKQIKVILNGTNFCPKDAKSDLIKQYHLEGKKILVCVGTILERKNQMQIVQAFKKDKELKNKIAVIFCGNDRLNGLLQKKISENKLSDSLVYVGAVSSEVLKEYYTIADGMIMPSEAEGLSIAALEMIAYGKPIILFGDSECAEDLNDANVVCFAEERTDESFIEAIWKWYGKEWNSEYIENYSRYYSMERMADDYIDYYNKLVCQAT